MTEEALNPVQVSQILGEALKQSFFDYVALKTMVTLGLRRAHLVGQHDPRLTPNPGMLIENLTPDGIWLTERKGMPKVFKKIPPEMRSEIDQVIGTRTAGKIFPRTAAWVWERMRHYAKKAGITFPVKPNMLYDFSLKHGQYLPIVLKNPTFFEQLQRGEQPSQTPQLTSQGEAFFQSVSTRSRSLPKPVTVNVSGAILGEKTFLPHVFSGQKAEAELEKAVIDNYRHVLGEGTLYLPLKKLVGSKLRKITDGLLLDFNDPKNPRFWIVEVELSSHDLESHVQSQMIGFLQALKDEKTLRSLLQTVSEYIWNDKTQDEKWVEQFYSPLWEGIVKSDYQYLDNLLHETCGLLIIIDRVTPELEQIVEFLSNSGEVRVVEFKTFKRDEELIHTFSRPDLKKSD